MVQQPAAAHAVQRDSDIVDLLKRGEQAAAFEELVERYERKIYRLCCSLLRDRAAAQDAAQESLVRIWKALNHFDQRASLSTWIYAVTRNRCLTAIERRRDAESRSDPGQSSELPAQLQAPADDDMEIDERSALLRELVDELPDRYRQALTLYYYEERSITESAEMLGVPQGTVKTNLFRARALLLDGIRRRGLPDPAHWLRGE